MATPTTKGANPTTVTTGKVRFSYANVHEPRPSDDNGTKKYSVSLIISKSDKETLAKVKAAIEAAFVLGENGKFGRKRLPKDNNPLRDGDAERPDDEAYKNSYFINASSPEKNKPGIVDANRSPIMNNSDFYSGCYGRANVNFFPFNFKGKCGVGCGLNHLQKLEDGDPLSSRISAEDAFGDDDDL